MKKLILIAIATSLLFAGVGRSREVNTEDSSKSMHGQTVWTNIVGGTLVYTNTLEKPSRLTSLSWVLPPSSTCTVTVQNVESRIVKAKNILLYTNNLWTPPRVETNSYWSETQTLVTNTLYNKATTNVQSAIRDAGVNGDLPEYYRILGNDILQFTFSMTNDIPLKWTQDL